MMIDAVTVRERDADVLPMHSLNSARCRVNQALDFALATGTLRAHVAAVFIWFAVMLLDRETWALSRRANRRHRAPRLKRFVQALSDRTRRRDPFRLRGAV